MKLLLFFTATFCCLTAMAQFNDSTHYYISGASSGIINLTDAGYTFVLTNAASFRVNKKNFVFNSNANWVYGQQLDRLTNNDITTGVDFNWYRKGNRRFYYWGLANYDKSFSLNIFNRSQSGVGVAYSIFDTTKAYLNLSNGILYEYVDLQLENGDRDLYNTIRNSFRLQYRFQIFELITWNGNAFIQNSLQYKDDYIIRANTGLAFNLNKWLSLTGAVTYNRLSRTNRENLLITFGAKAETYF